MRERALEEAKQGERSGGKWLAGEKKKEGRNQSLGCLQYRLIHLSLSQADNGNV